jgi:membrane protease YdiL (CAAX protease family)
MLEYPFTDGELVNGAVSIAVVGLLFLIHHFITNSEWFGIRAFRKENSAAPAIRRVMYKRLLGILFFGLIPLTMVLLVLHEPLTGYGLSTKHLRKSLLLWLPFASGIVAISYFVARNPKNLAMYPQIRIEQWNGRLLALSALGWTGYLAGYEFLFRGFLLFSCLESFGPWSALIINMSLYSLVHVPKGPRETFGSLPFGFLLCYTTLILGSIWFALLTHLTLALSNEWFSLRFQPGMKYVKNARGK